jgi:hypothetical protein
MLHQNVCTLDNSSRQALNDTQHVPLGSVYYLNSGKTNSSSALFWGDGDVNSKVKKCFHMAHYQYFSHKVIHSYFQMVITTMPNYQTGVLFYKMLCNTSMSPKPTGSSVTAKENPVSVKKFIFEPITTQVTEKHFHDISGSYVV